jgi:hypothetical protein
MVPSLLGPGRAGRGQRDHDALDWESHEGGFLAGRLASAYISEAIREAFYSPEGA